MGADSLRFLYTEAKEREGSGRMAERERESKMCVRMFKREVGQRCIPPTTTAVSRSISWSGESECRDAMTKKIDHEVIFWGKFPRRKECKEQM